MTLYIIIVLLSRENVFFARTYKNGAVNLAPRGYSIALGAAKFALHVGLITLGAAKFALHTGLA